MSWARMRFRGDRVLVRVDSHGQPVVDADGRAEMKYREGDSRSYRPAAANLEADTGGGASPASARAPATAKSGHDGHASARPAARKAHAPRRTGHGDGAAGHDGTAGHGAAGHGAAGHDVIHVWTDGACTGNPGPMGIGVVVIDGERRIEHGEYIGHGTNNIAELTAIERGLELVLKIDGGDRPLRVYSDSSYAIGLLSKGWKAKANQELVARLRQRVGAFDRIRFVKVEGHAGVADNERCDELATTAARQGR